jgi:hypothetical protein
MTQSRDPSSDASARVDDPFGVYRDLRSVVVAEYSGRFRNWRMPSADGVDKMVSRDDGGLPWKDLVDERVMEIGVQIGAAVLHHDESIVPVSRFH